MPTDRTALVRRFYDEVFGQGSVEAIDELLHDDFVEHEPLPLPDAPSGKEAPKAMIAMFRAAFPDLRATVEDVVQEGDKVAVRARMSGTHRGELMGIAPTGAAFDIQLMDIMEFRGDRVIAHWGVTDTAAMMEQLGLAEAPAG